VTALGRVQVVRGDGAGNRVCKDAGASHRGRRARGIVSPGPPDLFSHSCFRGDLWMCSPIAAPSPRAGNRDPRRRGGAGPQAKPFFPRRVSLDFRKFT
jgi:hypothetical protein